MLHPLCEVVQYPQHAAPGTTPLILIHDGGGTSFAYHCLDPLRRPVYAIANPHFHSGAPLGPGGIREMAELYVAMVRRTVDSDDFPDNGAARAQGRRASSWWTHIPLWKDYQTEIQKVRRQCGSMTEDPPRKNVLLARQAMTAAVEMIQSWELPQWPWQDDRPAEVGVNGYSATVPRVPGGPPPTVLLKATDGVPTKVAGEVSRVDLFRDQRDLGWGKYHPGFIGEVLDVDGHHYGLFDWARLSATTNKIKEACELLEKKPTWNEKRA
ncbi:Amt4 [Verticillium dahliae VdLs.17]|uniref:Amt4 n=1 Tax=Verticillium dahliae (strain VdLs.17 / ATCC MYA-4575 / FGSC 10137) TaxID=498257 RepID=G2X3N9_VERDV|nr:Amt4 [Verticillium dahliae VdLs.17]EGY23188.1 Amt4 [Verticillium dahliae VdLs.17]